MGVDAKMFVDAAKVRTDAEIRRLSFEMGEAFPGKFYGSREEDRHFLEPVDEYWQDGPTLKPKDGCQFIEVHLVTRYYGPDYERGDLPAILAVAEWLQARIPDGTVWYGGDSSGVCAKPLERHIKNRLWEHFVEHGHHPYNSHFDNDGVRPVTDPHNPGQPRPVCEFCGGVPMLRNGYGKDYAAFYCEGCRDRVERRDGKELWKSRGQLEECP